MTLLQATAHSVNTIFAQVVDAGRAAGVVDVAHRMGDPVAAGARVLDHARLGGRLAARDDRRFATLAAGGIHHTPEPLAR